MEQLSLYDFREKPKTWEDAGKLLNSSVLPAKLKQMLIFIAFTAQAQHSVRAIDLLLQMPTDVGVSDLEDVPLDEIRRMLAEIETSPDE